MNILTLADREIVIFTDGSSRGNPGPGGYGAVAIYPNAHGELHVDEVGGREDVTTNNRMELKAVIEGIKNFISYYENLSVRSFTFYIDSSYVVKGVQQWIKGWKRNNWITATKEPVKNRDLWEEISDLIEKGDGKGPLSIKWNLVPGHSGIAGNERCDIIATSFADNKPVQLYSGTLAGYQAEIVSEILDLSTMASAVEKKKKGKSSSSGKAAYSYVSYVDGKMSTDKSWAECEKKVKGKKGARFKKALSAEDEASIIQEFLKRS
ncbi:MAG TPA: RNase H family protein [Candidatus Paceibacterota bacterium]